MSAPSTKAPSVPKNDSSVNTTSDLSGRPTDSDALELRRVESERPLYRDVFGAPT